MHLIHPSDFFSADFIKLLVKKLVNKTNKSDVLLNTSCTHPGSTKHLRLKGLITPLTVQFNFLNKEINIVA